MGETFFEKWFHRIHNAWGVLTGSLVAVSPEMIDAYWDAVVPPLNIRDDEAGA